jgi:hypothetical protein
MIISDRPWNRACQPESCTSPSSCSVKIRISPPQTAYRDFPHGITPHCKVKSYARADHPQIKVPQADHLGLGLASPSVASVSSARCFR